MRFMNTYEIDEAVSLFKRDLVMGAAAVTLQNLRDWTNRNSDGWAYWPKPTRAAARLMTIVEDAAREVRYRSGLHGVSAADVRKAYVPIRAFLTRQHVDAKTIIVEVYA